MTIPRSQDSQPFSRPFRLICFKIVKSNEAYIIHYQLEVQELIVMSNTNLFLYQYKFLFNYQKRL